MQEDELTLNTEGSPTSDAQVGKNPGDDTPNYDLGTPADEATTTGTGEDDVEDTAHEPYVPYDRFAQVNGELKTLREQFAAQEIKAKGDEEYAEILAEIKQYGSANQFRQALAATQAEQAQVAQDARETQITASVEKMVEDGTISEDFAPQITELLRLKDRLEPVAQNLEQQRWEQQIDAGVRQLRATYPEMDEDYVRLSMESGNDPIAAAKKSHDHITAGISRYNAQKQIAVAGIPPTPGGGGGAAPTASRPSIPDPSNRAEFEKYAKEVDRRLGGR